MNWCCYAVRRNWCVLRNYPSSWQSISFCKASFRILHSLLTLLLLLFNYVILVRGDTICLWQLGVTGALSLLLFYPDPLQFRIFFKVITGNVQFHILFPLAFPSISVAIMVIGFFVSESFSNIHVFIFHGSAGITPPWFQVLRFCGKRKQTKPIHHLVFSLSFKYPGEFLHFVDIILCMKHLPTCSPPDAQLGNCLS